MRKGQDHWTFSQTAALLFRTSYKLTNFTTGEKFWNFIMDVELYEFTFVGCSVFSDGVHGVGLKQLTTILYVTIMLCFMLL